MLALKYLNHLKCQALLKGDPLRGGDELMDLVGGFLFLFYTCIRYLGAQLVKISRMTLLWEVYMQRVQSLKGVIIKISVWVFWCGGVITRIGGQYKTK